MKIKIALVVSFILLLGFFIVDSGFSFAAAKSLAALFGGKNANSASANDEVLKLNDQVQERKEKIKKLNSKIDEYQQKIETKRKEAASLQNQLALLLNRIAKTELEIEETKENMETTALEVRALNIQIEEKENLIGKEKKQLTEGIRRIDRADQRNRLEMLLLNDSFSEFFQEIAELEEVYAKLGDSIDRLQNLQSELKSKREESASKGLALEKLKAKLDERRESLLENQGEKEDLLIDSRLTAQKFQESIGELRSEQNQIDEELAALENSLRKRLKDSDFAASPDQVILSWPVDPGRGITTYFYDPDYPFRYIFEHAGIDIRAYQGTPVKAAASGYVVRAKNGGSRGYSYILLAHNGGISTLYGHLSVLSAAEGSFVERGSIIGYSGGKPGTPGAGPLTTGPHLHFETRLNSVPVDPLKYLIR